MSRTAGRGGPRVGIVMGSESDRPVMEEAARVLAEFGVGCEMAVRSAHRTPDAAREWALGARARGIDVIIAAAGGAAHLAGAMAAHSRLPVLGVPLASSPLLGFDALLSTVQMPPGVPVGTLGVGPWGARNAAHLALRILALGDEALARRLEDHAAETARKLLGQAAERKAAVAADAPAATEPSRERPAAPRSAPVPGNGAAKPRRTRPPARPKADPRAGRH